MNSRFQSPDPPFKIPDHELIRSIGRGSYGEVWLARNIMGLFRAVKFVRRESFDNARPFERELAGIRRFEPVSRSHDGFVDVLHIGQNESKDSFYYVMELGDDRVSGQEIDPEKYSPNTLMHEISKRGKLSCQECLQFGLGLTRALTALHKSGLVHRDIKPSNIIFVLGAPKLADIGLVAGIDEARSFVGTEGFIAPEGPGSAQADIYALGKVLYEAATGKDRLDFPELPTLLDESPDHGGLLELNEVIIRACADAPKRYRTAEEMHANLVLLANGKSLRRLKVLERRFANIKRAVRLSFIVLVVLAVLAIQGYREWKNVAESRKRQVAQSVKDGTTSLDSGDLVTALRHYGDGLQLDRGNADRELAHRMRFESVLVQCPKVTQLWFGEGRVEDAEFSPDGSKVVVAEAAGSVKIFDLQSPNEPPRSFGSGGYASATYSSNGLRILVVDQDKTVSLWDARALTNIYSLPHPMWVQSARFSPDGMRFVTACGDRITRAWDTLTGQLNLQLERQSKAVRYAAFSPDGKWMVTAGQDGAARIWDAANGTAVGEPLRHPKWVRYAAFSRDSRAIVTACEDGIARVWEVESGKRIRPDLHHNDVLCCVEYSPDGALLLTASLDGVVRLWHSDTLEPLRLNPVLTHAERVTSAAFDADGHRIVTACADGSVRVWDFAGAVTSPPALSRIYSAHANRFITVSSNDVRVFEAMTDARVGSELRLQAHPEHVVQSSDGQYVLAISKVATNESSNDCMVQVFSVSVGKRIGPALAVSNWFMDAALSADGSRIALFDDSVVEIRDVFSGKPVFPSLRPASDIAKVLFSPDGKRIATWGGNSVQLWDAKTGTSYAAFEMAAPVTSVEFSSNGSYLAAGCADGDLNKRFAQVWNSTTGKPASPPLWHGDGVLCASFSPDNKYLATGGEDREAMVWEFARGRLVFPPIRHPDQVGDVGFSPDGKWIVTICADRAARVFNAATGEPVTPPLRHLGNPRYATFLPDSRRFVTADVHGRTWLWELSANEASVDDLSLLSRFLSGDSLRAPGDSTPQQPAALNAIWERLRTNCAAAFTVSSNQVVAWHEFQAQQSEKSEQWPSAIFHWKALLKLRPNDPEFGQRLKDAEQKMQEVKPADE